MNGTGYPRLLLAAGASGSGKTTITCGILKALKNRGLSVTSFKCGPDYIDPMFHGRVIGTRARNLDTFFTDAEMTRYLFIRDASADISVMEGVMGYYDGLGGMSDIASAYDLARVTRTPAVLIVNMRGMSLSALAYIRGFVTYRPDSNIRGVILNQISPMLYPGMKARIEEELGVHVYGYVPKLTDCVIESRHLGLVMPDEVNRLEEKLQKLAVTLEETLELDGLLALAKSAQALEEENAARVPERLRQVLDCDRARRVRAEAPVIAAARDEAFCFIYESNLRLLRELGARIAEFSPLRDEKLPEEADGLLLFGGYPELHAQALSENAPMRADVREKIAGGLPCIAECGGFLYLHRVMEDMNGKKWPMAGVIDAEAYRTDKLTRFGYVTLRDRADETAEALRGHEFHYYDSTDNGAAYLAQKPAGRRSWPCIHRTGNLMAGFPHLYYYANPRFALDFCVKCADYKAGRRSL